jgi:hypothetical protein
MTVMDARMEKRVLELAKNLYDRGLTSSMTDAKRLALGMVEGERKLMTKTAPEPVVEHVTKLNLPDEFSAFVDRAAVTAHRDVPVREPPRMAPSQRSVFYADAPSKPAVQEVAQRTVQKNEEAPQQVMRNAQRPQPDASPRAVPQALTEKSLPPPAEQKPEEAVLAERTIELPKTASQPLNAPSDDLAKQHGIDLFDIFRKKQ